MLLFRREGTNEMESSEFFLLPLQFAPFSVTILERRVLSRTLVRVWRTRLVQVLRRLVLHRSSFASKYSAHTHHPFTFGDDCAKGLGHTFGLQCVRQRTIPDFLCENDV